MTDARETFRLEMVSGTRIASNSGEVQSTMPRTMLLLTEKFYEERKEF